MGIFLGIVLYAGVAAASAQEHPGRVLFDAAGCRSCHRIGPVGGTSGPDLTYVGFRRSREWLDLWLQNPKAWKPDTLMPDFRLKPRSRAAIVDYLASLKGQDFGSGGPPWNRPELRADPVRRGRVLYARAGCVACHGPGGSGGHPNNNVPGGAIPALTGVSQTYSREELASKIRFGSRPAKADPRGPEPLVFMPPWGDALSDADISAVADYVLTLGPGRAQTAEW